MPSDPPGERRPAGTAATPPTLEVVAARAGVGRGTVSRVVNGSSQVSEQTRARVRQAIDELGYVPNTAARALATRRTGAVALVISESQERVFGEPYFAEVVRGITAVVGAASRQLLLVLAPTRDDVLRPDYLTPAHVDGVLMLSAHEADSLPGTILGRGLPLVLGGRPDHPGAVSHVDVDNRGGARIAVEHLLSRGCMKVAHLAGPRDMAPGRDRHEGYLAALEAAGRPRGDALVEWGDFTEGEGARCMRRLLEAHPEVDGVFAASDAMALGAMRVLREAGRCVPGDVALVGFDDSPLAVLADPPLTTVHQPVEDLGVRMAHMLLGQIAQGGTRPPERVVLDTWLVRRDSA